MPESPVNGILLVDKPAGWTSFDVLAKLRGALHTRKLGHAGTLDPMATGLLVVFAGNATAAAFRLPEHDKTYEAAVRLGVRTDTGDVTGRVLEQCPVPPGLDAAAVRNVLPRFLGAQQQTPPMYSAVKVNGVPLYKAARAGKEVARQPRTVTVHALEYLGAAAPDTFLVRVRCSMGTYVRVLAEDIGQALGVPAALAALRRTAAGAFSVEDAHPLPDILAAAGQGTLLQNGWLLGIDAAFGALPALTVDAPTQKRLYNGCPTRGCPAADGRYRVYTGAGAFFALATVRGGVLEVEKRFWEEVPADAHP